MRACGCCHLCRQVNSGAGGSGPHGAMWRPTGDAYRRGSYAHCRNVTGRGMAALSSTPGRVERVQCTDRPGPGRIRANLPGNCRTRSYARLPMPEQDAMLQSRCSRPGSDTQHATPLAQNRDHHRVSRANSFAIAADRRYIGIRAMK
ncbi:hypothetical protein PAHAL_5G103200 [Panicum hallii]|uniref:Uncharacterized protein n=1 Tax=Panicum hallii TaxID=206008 RepID=A0A2T8IJN9_9POAL|nr:hypothetical protein PAHAL_5G103200 [Panicum hallii]